MKPRQFFPLGKAYGEAFCNRVEEIKKLAGNIESGKHTFIVAPRRYGKSSLCEKVLASSKLPWEKLDFHLSTNSIDVERTIINGVGGLIGKSIGPLEKLINLVRKYSKKLRPKLELGTEYMRLQFEFSSDSSAAENIAEALLLLEKLLRENNKQAVLLLDEFQEIGEIDVGKSLEGALRHAAQETRNLSLVFSGSSPHLLKNMFEDERRPLYKLCRKLTIDRIAETHYQLHLNKAAKLLWKTELPKSVFERIMQLSERHPYYVNYLCDELWSQMDKMPTVADVDEAWSMVAEEERSDLLKDFFALPENQRKLLIYFANDGGNIYSSAAARKMEIPTSSISRAISALVEKDFLESSKPGYRLIVPVYKKILRM
jgi:uncharacterized protein